MNGHLAQWLRALGAVVLVVAVLPLSAGPVSADSSAGRGADKSGARCEDNATSSPGGGQGNGNGNGRDCADTTATPAGDSSVIAATMPDPGSTAKASSSGSAPAPSEAEKERGNPAEAAKDNGKPADAAKDNGKPADAAKDNGKPEAKPKGASGDNKANAPTTHGPKADAPKTDAPKAPSTQPTSKDNGKKPGSGGGHTPVNVCHATSSDSNPYVFITVDDDSVKAQGHLMHRDEPNKTWKSDGLFRGSPVEAGDPKRDLIGDYTDSAGVRHVYDGVINSEADCGSLTPPPPPPPPVVVVVKATGSFVTVCTATAAVANVGSLTTGSAAPGSFRIAGTDFSIAVVSNQTSIAVPADAVLRLEYVPTSGSVQVLQILRSEKACPAFTPPPTGELSKTSVPPTGSVVTPGQVIDYTVTVRNTGQVAITSAPVVDTLPDRVTVVPATVSDNGVVSADGRTITWTANLAPGASETYTYQGRVDATAPAGTSLVNKVTFLLMERTTTHPVGDRSLEVRKAASAAVVQFGDPLTYTLTVRALGTLGQTGVVVRDGIPAGTTYVSGSAACDASGPCMESFANNEVTWTLGAMAPGATRTVTFRVTVDTPRATAESGIPAVTIRNVGLGFSTEVPPTPSNEVLTDVVAVGGVKNGPNGPGGSDGPAGPDGGPSGPNTDDDVSVAPTSGGPLAQTGGGLPFGAVLLFGGLLLLAGIALLRVGLSPRARGMA